jgi:HEAT repeat protein
MQLNALHYWLNSFEAPPGEYRIKVKAILQGIDNEKLPESNEIRIVVKAKPGEPPKPGEPTQEERIKQLIADLGSNDWETRENATEELTKIGEPVVEALVALTKDSTDPEVVWRAQSILRELGYVTDEAISEKVQAILDGIKANDWTLKETIGLEIVRLGPRVIGTLRSYLDNSDYRIRQVAVELLGKIPDKAIVQILIDALDDGDNYVRASAAKELRRISGQTLSSAEKAKWQEWWDKNKEGFHLPEVKLPEPPPNPGPGPGPRPLPPEPMPLRPDGE